MGQLNILNDEYLGDNMSKYWKKSIPSIIAGLRVEVRDGNVEKALRIFSKKVQNSGILKEYKERQEFVKPSVKKRRAKKAAAKEGHTSLDAFS